MLRHSKVELALHRLKQGGGRPLLVLHGLGLRSPDELPLELASWPGPVFALDFTGHGASTIPAGGGYTAEILMADADTAIAHLGPSTVLGRGLGAYVALLLSGARPKEVLGAILDDGPGLAGGGDRPGSSYVPFVPQGANGSPDPFALAELARDIRPTDYATNFLRQAAQFSPLEYPVFVVARARPPWLEAVVAEPGVREGEIEEALELYGA